MKLQRLVSRLVLISLACGAFASCAVKSRDFGTSEKPGGKVDASTDGAAGTGGTGTGASTGSGGSGKGGTSGTSGTGNGGGDGGQVCTPKQPACDGNRATTCSDDGTGYAAGGTDCAGQTCDHGACKCIPKTTFCQANAVYTCASDGTSSRTEACGKHQYCDASDTKNLKCTDQVCDPGTYNCAADGVQPVKCADDGSAEVPDGPPCDGVCEGAGECICIPGTKRCTGGTPATQPQVCINPADAGPSWVNDGAPCEGPPYAGCSAGRCVTKSITVSYGNYDRVVNGVSYHAITNNFLLDKYEVTVGQFRRFVDAVIAGWVPVPNTGKHVQAHPPNGLANSGTANGYELGWDSTWTRYYPLWQTKEDWDFNLVATGAEQKPSIFATWTPAIGKNENKPIGNINWYEAYAYCIWDGGFLPTEAEWEWAAGGDPPATAIKLYPWGSADPGTQSQYAVYGCFFPEGTGQCKSDFSTDNIAEVDKGPAEAGKSAFGQVHMAGNVWEWVLDWDATPTYPAQCDNCANLSPAPAAMERVHRGGDFRFTAADLQTDAHRKYQHNYRDPYGGVRCARAVPL